MFCFFFIQKESVEVNLFKKILEREKERNLINKMRERFFHLNKILTL